jgi:hypothetical protein
MSHRTRIAALERRLAPANPEPTLIRITGGLPDSEPMGATVGGQEWSRDAKGPAPSDAEAEPLARLVLDALASPSWRQEFDAGREHDADLARERRVAAAIKILQVDLPRYRASMHCVCCRTSTSRARNTTPLAC